MTMKDEETVESIRNYGVLMPGNTRPRAGAVMRSLPGTAGSTWRAGRGFPPCRCPRDYSDDEATVIMVDTNIQREDILHSEKRGLM